jgi:hypothetical protein
MTSAFSHPVFLAPAGALALLALAAGLCAQGRPGVGVVVVAQRPWMLGLGCALMLAGLGLGLAEPRWGLPEHPRLTVHVVLDASRSMQARDVGKKTRWEAAVAKLDRLWSEHRPGLRCSLDLLTGDLVPVLPPGEDSTLLRDALRALTPGEIGSPGTSLGRGITQAVKQVEADEPAVLLLLGDGEETWEAEAMAETHALAALKQAKLPLFAVALGEPTPVPVPNPQATDTKAPESSPAPTSAAHPQTFQRLAEASGGKLLKATDDLAPILLALAEGREPLPVGRSKQPAHPEWGAWVALVGLALWMAGAGRPMARWRVRL